MSEGSRFTVHPLRIVYPTSKQMNNGDDLYARHRIIPGWEQGRLEKLKLFVVGLGGNGALCWSNLLALGVGSDGGWIKACDPDILEISNLSRIPYATVNDIKKTKAELAQEYAIFKAPGTKVACYPLGIEDPLMQDIAKEANIIVINVDRDGPRKLCNQIAIRYFVQLIDIATYEELKVK